MQMAALRNCFTSSACLSYVYCTRDYLLHTHSCIRYHLREAVTQGGTRAREAVTQGGTRAQTGGHTHTHTHAHTHTGAGGVLEAERARYTLSKALFTSTLNPKP
jgi:hypothetical protein